MNKKALGKFYFLNEFNQSNQSRLKMIFKYWEQLF